MEIFQFEIILYVSDQERSRSFYSAIFKKKPELDVPGMTEFRISKELKLGLMPEKGISKILDGKTPHPESGNGIPRCELYILTEQIEEHYKNSLDAGAKEVSEIADRDWGDRVGYVIGPRRAYYSLCSEINRSLNLF